MLTWLVCWICNVSWLIVGSCYGKKITHMWNLFMKSLNKFYRNLPDQANHQIWFHELPFLRRRATLKLIFLLFPTPLKLKLSKLEFSLNARISFYKFYFVSSTVKFSLSEISDNKRSTIEVKLIWIIAIAFFQIKVSKNKK